MPKPHRMIVQRPPPPSPPKGTPRQHQQKTHEKQKLNPPTVRPTRKPEPAPNTQRMTAGPRPAKTRIMQKPVN